MPKQRGGWEYPLSREEKKQRVMYLFEAELAMAEHTNAENLEALQTLLEKRQSTGSSPQKPRNAVPVAGADIAVSLGTSGSRPSRSRLELGGMGLLGGLVVLVVAWLCRSTACPNNESNAHTFDRWIGDASANLTDRVLGMRQEGHIRLKLSNCAEADWWFASALHLISATSNVSEAYHNHIVGERGFALVCSGQFEDGARLLEQHLKRLGFKGFAHLLNALGYAYFQTQDFKKSAEFFELAMKADNFNPVPWNNLAAASMMTHDLERADYALNQAAMALNQLNVGPDDHYNMLIRFNLEVLYERAQQGQESPQRSPWVDIWNGYV